MKESNWIRKQRIEYIRSLEEKYRESEIVNRELKIIISNLRERVQNLRVELAGKTKCD